MSVSPASLSEAWRDGHYVSRDLGNLEQLEGKYIYVCNKLPRFPKLPSTASLAFGDARKKLFQLA